MGPHTCGGIRISAQQGPLTQNLPTPVGRRPSSCAKTYLWPKWNGYFLDFVSQGHKWACPEMGTLSVVSHALMLPCTDVLGGACT
jgi:hypothetical protein